MTIYDGAGNEIHFNEGSGNSYEQEVYSAELTSVSEYKQVTLSLAPGRYMLNCEGIVSSDIDGTTCQVYFINSVNNKVDRIYLERGQNISAEFDLLYGCSSFVFCCGDSIASSAGDTATFTGVSLIQFNKRELEKYPFWGKKFAIIGDSFSAGEWMWSSTMCEELHAIQEAVVGESGARWTVNDQRPDIPCAYEQAQLLVSRNASPHYIYAFLGVNDCGNGISIGELVKSKNISDFDLHTVCGGIQACLNYLQNNFPNAVIRTGYTPNGYFYSSSLHDSEPYTEAIKTISTWYAVEYMDTLNCGLSTLSAVYEDCWEIPSSITGGHPNAKGHKIIGKGIARKTLFGG